MGDPGDGLRLRQRAPRARRATCPAFAIDRTPVTNGRLRRVRGGRRLRAAASSGAPRAGPGAQREARRAAALLDRGRRRAALRPLEPLEPGHAGDARLLVRGRRLRALGGQAAAHRGRVGEGGAWDAGEGARRYPWGDEAVARRPTSTSSTSARPGAPRGRTPTGDSMLGDCWEWTASHFDGYPGFEAFPYREYSEVFFGRRYRVLRGASWATRPSVAPQHLPQLGPSPSAARSSPASGARRR